MPEILMVKTRGRSEGTIEKLLREIDAAIVTCRNDIAERRRELDALEAARAGLLQGQGNAPSYPITSEPGAKEDGAKPKIKKKRRERGNSMAAKVRNVARQAIREAGHPLKGSEILDHLLAAGVSLTAKEPGKFVAKVLWASDEFDNEGRGYWIKGKVLESR